MRVSGLREIDLSYVIKRIPGEECPCVAVIKRSSRYRVERALLMARCGQCGNTRMINTTEKDYSPLPELELEYGKC